MASVSTLSYDDLLHRARERLTRSYGPTLAGRTKLVDLIEELRAAAATVDGTDLLGDEGWRIVSIEIQGFGGIANADVPLRIELSPVPGVTVVRGDNGSGKSP